MIAAVDDRDVNWQLCKSKRRAQTSETSAQNQDAGSAISPYLRSAYGRTHDTSSETPPIKKMLHAAKAIQLKSSCTSCDLRNSIRLSRVLDSACAPSPLPACQLRHDLLHR